MAKKKNNGKSFEKAIKESAEKQEIFFERFPDSNKFNQGGNNGIRFTLNSPCDCFMFDCYYMYYLELKSTINTSFSFPQPIDVKPPKGKTYMIKYHQIKSLLERSKFPHIFCGLLLDFADRTNSKGEVIEGGCYFIEINTFVGWARSIGKASINQKDAKLIGIKVDRTKKIVNYTYDIRSMCDNIIRQYL